jgi:hypothetical protein
METLTDNLTTQNVNLEIQINKKLQQITQIVLTEFQNSQEHLFSEEAAFLTEEERLEILLDSVNVKKTLVEKLDNIIRNII